MKIWKLKTVKKNIKKTEKNFCDLELDNNFLDGTPQARSIEEKKR